MCGKVKTLCYKHSGKVNLILITRPNSQLKLKTSVNPDSYFHVYCFGYNELATFFSLLCIIFCLAG